MTLAYTGKNLDRDQLCKVAQWILSHWALEKITITEAYVNSFKTSDGKERHDVLLKVSNNDIEEVNKTRDAYLRSKFDHADTFFTHEPHITHSICATKSEAVHIAKMLNDIDVFPYPVDVTGVTID